MMTRCGAVAGMRRSGARAYSLGYNSRLLVPTRRFFGYQPLGYWLASTPYFVALPGLTIIVYKY
jgi:hypothetical protein